MPVPETTETPPQQRTHGWMACYPDGTPHIVIMRDDEELAWQILGGNVLDHGIEMRAAGWTLRRVEVRSV